MAASFCSLGTTSSFIVSMSSSTSLEPWLRSDDTDEPSAPPLLKVFSRPRGGVPAGNNGGFPLDSIEFGSPPPAGALSGGVSSAWGRVVRACGRVYIVG